MLHKKIVALGSAFHAGLQTKDAPGIDTQLTQHIELVTKALENLKQTDKTVEEKLREHDVHILELAQKLARRTRFGMGADDHQTWGAKFVQAKAADLEGMGRSDRVSMELKASLTSSTADVAGAAGDLVVPQRDQLLLMTQRRLTIRNLLNVVKATSGSVEYPQQTGRTNNAAMVAEGDAKPQSDFRFDMKNVPMRVIAHWVKASRQILEDAPQLQGLIDSELRYGLALQEEAQILYGDNTGQNLPGLFTSATAFAAGGLVVTNPTKIDVIGAAILQASLTDIPPDGIVVHPSDWWSMRLTKDADGKYILGDPLTPVALSLFGLPVVPTQACIAGQFMVGAYGAQTLYDRWEARVEIGFVNDDFTRNLVTVLGEERVGLAAKRPEALIKGTYAAAITDLTS